ncbi:hypothetical protein H072_4276 [Dactylellina haptotyla CBS 200.50]|uniref:Aminotransferase class V domain-containing protein n=1 Tax=Dactylellina haptotyla (strain CBS 200.50) TaxID=1284197 RepID=S8BQT3_DACHA|nr:hypothetical protein H072_4276 [Dactylellina haptotyla CBS 200.50]
MPSYSSKIEEIRRKEYGYIKDVTYLDHAGCTLYPSTLIHQFTQDLTSNLFGNPHSASPSSMLSSERIESVRSRVLQFFNASPEHFDVVFVANATAAIKVVMEGFRDLEGGYWYGYHRDSHTSLAGVREHATVSRCFARDSDVEEWISAKDEGADTTKLFAYPAQSNMNGRRSPLQWCGQIRRNKAKTYTLLDAAAFLTTGNLDLSNHEDAPDFISMSFYKIFGFPDLGALLVRKTSADILMKRKYFGGGTVEMVISVGNSWHSKRKVVHSALEDGTLPFHNIVALGHAMDAYQQLYGSAKNVSSHTAALAKTTYERLSAMKYSNGNRVCEMYKDPLATYDDATTQGPTVAFNVYNWDGSMVGKSKVEEAAIKNKIHLRSGGVCNPGGVATVLQLSHEDMRKNFDAGMRCGDKNDIMAGKHTGIVRVSFGAMSSMADVDRFMKFMEATYLRGGMSLEVPSGFFHEKAGSIKKQKSGGLRMMIKNIARGHTQVSA